MSGDNSLISFAQFFTLLKDKTHAQDGSGGIEFEHSEKNVSCFFLPILGYNWFNGKVLLIISLYLCDIRSDSTHVMISTYFNNNLKN